MPIPKSVRSKDLKGKRVVTDRKIINGAGFIIDAGTEVSVLYISRGFCIQTDKCPCCGVQVKVRGITREEVSLPMKE